MSHRLPSPSAATCLSCGYALTGLEPDAAEMVLCPECGTHQLPRVAPRPRLRRLLLWCTLPTIGLCSCCAVLLLLEWVMPLLWFAAGAALVGIVAPMFGAALAAGHWDRRVKQAWPLVLIFGWGLNLAIGTLYMGIAFSIV